MKRLFLTYILILSATFCHAKINGTFIQSWLYSSWNDERWEEEISYMKEVGMDEIIMADVASKSSRESTWQCSYPSSLPNTTRITDETRKILLQSQKYNMKLFLGLGSDNRWWNWNLCNDNDYQDFSEAMSMACSIARELYSLYKNEFGETFSGFYSVYEIWNHIEWNNPKGRSLYADRMAEQFNRLIDTLNAIDPSMPLLFSPFSTQADWCADIENTKAFYEEFFQKCHFREIDGMLPMDNIGGGGQTLETVEPWSAMYAKVIENNNGKPKCFANIESFVQPADSLLYDTEKTPLYGINYWGSAPLGRFIKQLNLAEKYAEKIYTFAYPHYQSPNNNLPGIHESLIEYLNNKEIDSTHPTLPSAIRFEMTAGINNYTQLSSPILKISWDDDYYDENDILCVRLLLNGNCVAYRTSTRAESGNSVHEPDYILYPGFKDSENRLYQVSFIDSWGNETLSEPFEIDLERGENRLSENTLISDNFTKKRDKKIIRLTGDEVSIVAQESGLYRISIYTISGALTYSKKQWLKSGINRLKITTSSKMQSPFAIIISEK